MGHICFHPSVLSGWRTEQPSPECFLLPVQVPSSEFCKIFQKKFRFPNGTLESLKVYDPHMGSEFRPSSKADMWSLWVGRVLHTLVTYIAKPNGDPWRIGTQPNSFFLEIEIAFHYATEAKSLANRVWVQTGILSRTETVPEPSLAPQSAREWATWLHDRGLWITTWERKLQWSKYFSSQPNSDLVECQRDGRRWTNTWKGNLAFSFELHACNSLGEWDFLLSFF